MAEKNVQELRVNALQSRDQSALFAGRDLPRLIAQLSKPKPPQEMRGRFSYETNVIKGKTCSVLALLRDDKWSHAPERGDLPVDVEHLRLQKRRAIKCCDRARVSCHVERSRDIPRRYLKGFATGFLDPFGWCSGQAFARDDKLR